MPKVLRASSVNDYFWEPFEHKRYYDAEVEWYEGAVEGAEFGPYEGLGSIRFGGVAYQIGTDGFCSIHQLLVNNGARVKPGQPLVEVVERRPTLEEWEAQRDRASRAEDRVRELERLERIVRNPLRSLYFALTGHDWR